MYSPSDTGQQLLAALAAGDRTATETIYRQQFPVVSGWLIKNGGSSADAADVFQEAMVVLFSKAEDEAFRLTCSIGTYLFAISKHIWYKKLQQQNRQPAVLSHDPGEEDVQYDAVYEDDINVHHEREAHYEQLDTALEQIGEPCRSLLKAYYHQDKNMQEIAADFGYTNADNAKTQKYKCLARLRKIFYGMHAR